MWQNQPELDVWMIWNIWQVANPELADAIELEPEYRLYRDTAVALTTRGKSNPAAVRFVEYLQSPKGESIFRKWGWQK